MSLRPFGESVSKAAALGMHQPWLVAIHENPGETRELEVLHKLCNHYSIQASS